MKAIKLLVCVIFLAAALPAVCQSVPQSEWAEVITAINKKNNLSDIKTQLLQLRQQALANADYASAGRCWYYGLLVDDQRTEDTLFFKNARFMDSIIRDGQAPQLLKTIMYVLKAKRLHAFAQRFSYRNNKNRIASYDVQNDYGTMSHEALESIINTTFETALQASGKLKEADAQKLLWLCNDPLEFLFKPAFTDIIYAEWINVLPSTAHYNETNATAWLLLSQDAFAQMADTTTAFGDKENVAFKLYKRWMQYHGPQQPEAYYFIETLARKYFYHNLVNSTEAKKQYEQYLTTIAASSYNTVKANGVYQLCLLWNSEAAQYNPITSMGDYHNYMRYIPATEKKFDSSCRLYYNKALALFNDNRSLLDSFAFMRDILLAMEKKIKAPDLTIEAKENQLPGNPIPVMLHYRNIPKLYTRVVRISPLEDLSADKIYKLQHFRQLPTAAKGQQLLPLSNDYQFHNAFLKVDALPIGRYAILYSDTTIGSSIDRTDFLVISVTTIAVINNDKRIFVLDRKTGYPLQDALLYVNYNKNKDSAGTAKKIITESAPYKINEKGYADINEQDVNYVKVIHVGDTIKTTINTPDEDKPEDIYDKDKYDNLEDYYEDNLKINIFTDRAIYRPGQRVYYKGICIIHDPKTGEPLVLNKENLQQSFFQKLFHAASSKLAKEKIELYIKNPFDKAVDTLRVRVNEFGSFSGAFTIAKEAATGDWSFDGDTYEIDRSNRGDFKVEEYKRPSFELSVKQPVNELYLGDSFTVKVQVKSFTGARLDNVLVKYSVERSGDIPSAEDTTANRFIYSIDKILSGQSFTNNNGELLLHINDSILYKYHFSGNKRWNMRYAITAEAIDASGESHEENTTVTLSNRPIVLTVPIAKAIDRNELQPMYISARSPFAGAVKKQVEVRIYKIPFKQTNRQNDNWAKTDVSLYKQGALEVWFPEMTTDTSDAATQKILVYTTTITAGGDEKLIIPKDVLLCGNYHIEVTCTEHGNITGEIDKEFAVFDKAARTLPGATPSFHYMQNNSVEAGKPVYWLTGNTEQDIFSIYHIAYFKHTRGGVSIQYDYDVVPEKKGLNEWQHIMPAAVDKAELTHIYIVNNQLYRDVQDVYVPDNNAVKPEIIVEQYRKILTPGGKEAFTVSIKTKNENMAAEMMTTMYDATLDKLAKHEWRLPNNNRYIRINSKWDRTINDDINSTLYYNHTNNNNKFDTAGLWWINGATYRALGFRSFLSTAEINNSLEGKVAGLEIGNASGLDEVVVTGYGTAIKRNMTGFAVTIRGQKSLTDYGRVMVILDGVLYQGDISKIDPNTITNGLVLNGADAVALYGSSAAAGVLLLSTKGQVQLPAPPEIPVPVIRKNFAETAFFYPQVYAGKNGYYNITFTLPESVTEWKWQMLAHTKKADVAYAERTLYSQLPLMVQPNMPRFLYQGDAIKLQCRITNLDTVALEGNLHCIAEDAVTGEDITTKLLTTAQQHFTVMQTSNRSDAFVITVPPNMLHPLRIKITATTNAFSDGEEHIIPVLARKVLVSENIPIIMQGTKHVAIAKPILPADAELYGTGIYIAPKPNAAMLNALPYLAEYPYGCAEQTFNKLLAYTMAIQFTRTDTAIQQSLLRLNKKKDTFAASALPDELSEQTMPWLQLNHSTEIHQQKLAKLLDTLQAHQNIEKYFADIVNLQNSDGGVSWFKGGESSLFISNYLLAGFGKLQKSNLVFVDEHTVKTTLHDFLSKLVSYVDNEAVNPKLGRVGVGLEYVYARSFWLSAFSLSPALKIKIDTLLAKSLKDADGYSLGKQALLIIATLQYAEKESAYYKQALQQLKSLKQLAVTDDINGTRWKKISDDDDINMQSEECVAKIAEAFKAGGQTQTVEGIVQWLLQTKTEHNWGTTKSTAEVVGLLNTVKTNTSNTTANLTTTIDDTTLQVTNDLLSGRLTAFVCTSGRLAADSIVVQSNTMQPVVGGINYYYFTANPPANKTTENISMSKQLYKYNNVTLQWDSIAPNTILHIADKIKIVLAIEAPKQLNYVFIEDKHAAALEPLDAESGYMYGSGLGYYKSVRDAGMQFFAEKIPSGISTISYETKVSAEGSFTNGPASLQCMYKPSLHVYSNSSSISVKQ